MQFNALDCNFLFVHMRAFDCVCVAGEFGGDDDLGVQTSFSSIGLECINK